MVIDEEEEEEENDEDDDDDDFSATSFRRLRLNVKTRQNVCQIRMQASIFHRASKQSQLMDQPFSSRLIGLAQSG